MGRMVKELSIGTALGTTDPAHVLAHKLNRHTFWCGQSGSGKTYALGVMLEQVLLHTRLPVVILDPNSDFVRLAEVRDTAPDDVAEELRTRDIRVRRSSAADGEPLKVTFLDMGVRARAAVLQLDPVADAEDFNAVLRAESALRGGVEGSIVDWFRRQDDPAQQRIATRLENLGIADWDLWARGDDDINDLIDEKPDVVVADIGGFANSVEPKAAALAILDHLWANRASRVGRLIVIDEAHNLCPPDPVTAVEKLLAERIVQIAAEGRKYGLWLLLSTQRPSKVHPNALSQCDNLALMKMSSRQDLEELGRVFGYAPEGLLSQASSFTQGQTLFAGGFVPQAQLVQMGERLTEEGGSDVVIELR
ncbi:ATP-binding protein [Microbacterium sp. NIBRBAC000506063]|uniref:ATP-binding protein n=1 Tax=Microbacterium sp. NIBRBAC000506063 TaxID=2734618 RepID=UPI001CB74422|nr:ATP-binding protein [Microbacterium sp. NIBRBAC000506063]